jgi:hypothetical protein
MRNPLQWAGLLVSALAFGLVGCATPVRIDSEPTGARIEISGSFVGYTPIDVNLSVLHDEVLLSSPGFVSVDGELETTFDQRSLWSLPLFPLLLIPAIRERLHPHYRIQLMPGEGVEQRQVAPAQAETGVEVPAPGAGAEAASEGAAEDGG